MELTTRLSTLPLMEQKRVCQKVFEKFQYYFGSQFLAKYGDLEMDTLCETWAAGLGHLSIGAIKYGINESIDEDFPPSLGRFRELCKGYIPPITNILIEDTRSRKEHPPEDREKTLQRIREMKEMLFRNKKVEA